MKNRLAAMARDYTWLAAPTPHPRRASARDYLPAYKLTPAPWRARWGSARHASASTASSTPQGVLTLDKNVPFLFSFAMQGRRKIAKLERRALPPNIEGGRTLFFLVHGIGRPDFLDPEQVPDFEGDVAWFELERVRGKVWRTWKVLRQVKEPEKP